MSAPSITPCPPRVFPRDLAGVSDQSSCVRGLGGPGLIPRNGDVPARGEAVSTASLRPISEAALALMARLEELLIDRRARLAVEGTDLQHYQSNQRTV